VVNDDPQGRFDFGAVRTPGGHALDECVSALQKCIRRGKTREAAYFASELEAAGYAAWCWRRLEVIASEDVGLAWREGPAVIAALRMSYDAAKKREKDRTRVGNSALFLMHTVVALSTSSKSRMIDHLVAVMYVGPRPQIEMTPEAVDAHTARGRREGLGSYDESYRIVDPAPITDEFEAEARRLDGVPPRQES
jgi:replication-associated recombination protein RarA